MKRHLAFFGPLYLVVLFLGAFLAYPAAYVFKEALFFGGQPSLALARDTLANPVVREALANSLLVAAATTALSALLGLPLAAAWVRCRFAGRALLTGLLLAPMIMPPFVGAIGMRQFLARFGSVNLLLMRCGLITAPVDWLGAARFWGVVLVEALHLYPIMVLNVAAAMANIDPTLVEAARNMGSNRRRVFRRVLLPLTMPGLFAGSIIVFIWAFTDLGTPLVFEYRRVLPVLIFDRVNDLAANPEGYVLVVLMLVLSAAAFLLGKRWFGSRPSPSVGRGGAAGNEVTPGPLGQALIISAFLAVFFLACLPHLGVVLASLRSRWFMTILPEGFTLEHYRNALGHELTLPGIRNSILLSSLSTLADLVLGITIAYYLVRRPFKGRDALDALAMLPLAVPGLVLAFGYVAAFAGTPLDPRANPLPLLVIAYAVRRLPYVVRAAYAGFQQVPPALEEAAANMGSPPLRALRRVTLPLIGANLIAGGILAFAFAMLEVSDSLILAMKERFFPITKTIYQFLGRIEDGPSIAAALGSWAMIFLALAFLTAARLLGRRMGQLFRA